MNKFIKTLIIINGLIIPIFTGIFVFKYFSDLIGGGNDFEESVIVGEDLAKAKKDSLALQGISYDSPIPIYNSTNRYLPISVKTYEEARKMDLADTKSTFGIGHSPFTNYSENHINVLFLNKDYKVIGQLLDKKANISTIFIPATDEYKEYLVDKSVKHIAYLIAFEDSNKDGKLNSSDNHDLYISDLEGKNLEQITSQKEVIDYQFVNDHTEILVRFKERNDLRDEYKPIKFGLYYIESKTFTELKEIEDKLQEIESVLMR